MATINLALATLGMPEPYIRGNYNKDRIAMWTDQIRAHVEELRADTPTLSDADLARKAWFLPIIHVVRLDKPQTYSYKSGGKTLTTTISHRILDGVHRFYTAGLVGLSTLEAEEHAPMSAGAAYALQYKLNHDGPLPFDRESRDAAIRQMAKFKGPGGKPEFTQEQIAAQTGLTRTQISRILSGRSRGKTAEQISRARGKGQKKKNGKRKARATGGYDAAKYFSWVKVATREGKAHMKALAQYIVDHDQVWDYCEDLSGFFEGLRQEATKLEKASA